MKQPAKNGFTLIELMIVVAIIGIIAAIAYPSYINSVRDTRRTTAQSDLLQLAQWMERQYSADYSYQNAGADPALPFAESPQEGTAFYDLSFNGNVTQNTFQLQAVPKGDQTNDSCGTLRVDQTGARSFTGSGDCW